MDTHLESSKIFRWKIRPFFKWFDFWIGIYFDRDGRAIYICPLPMLGIKVWWWHQTLEQKAKYAGAREVLEYIQACVDMGNTLEWSINSAKEIFREV